MNTPNYYAIIPADVRYNNNLSANAKLFYGEISALTDKYGFCWDKNEYFMKLYSVSKQTIHNWLDELESEQVIFRETKSSPLGGKERIITIVKGGVGKEKLTKVGKEKLTSSINITSNDIKDQKEKEKYLNFNIGVKDEIYEDSYETRDGILIPHLYWSSTQKPLSQREIKELEFQEQKVTKMVKTKQERSEFAKQAPEILKQKQNLYKLDGTENIAKAEELRDLFQNHLKKDMNLDTNDDKELIKNFGLFLDLVIQHPFHGKNSTNIGYLVRNFNKITREINGK